MLAKSELPGLSRDSVWAHATPKKVTASMRMKVDNVPIHDFPRSVMQDYTKRATVLARMHLGECREDFEENYTRMLPTSA